MARAANNFGKHVDVNERMASAGQNVGTNLAYQPGGTT